MKLYQKFLYSILLVSLFVWYANTKHSIEQSYQLKINALHTEYSGKMDILKVEIVDGEKLLEKAQNDYEILLGQIKQTRAQNEATEKKRICDYITTNYKRTPPSVANEISNNIVQASKEKQLAVPLLIGIIEVESNFNPFAVSKVKARGLMQVMPEWIGKLPTDLQDRFQLHDIKTGIYAGADVFNIHLAENNHNVNKALYDYVNKDNAYVLKVYTAVGKFLAFTRGE